MADLWITPEELSGTLSSEALAHEACSTASFILWTLSGRKYTKTRTVTETYECPCRRAPSDLELRRSQYGVYPIIDNGAVTNRTLSDGDCGCGPAGHTRLRLEGQPVRAVLEVVGASGALDPASFRVYNSGLLELDSVTPGGVCGLTVTYTWGTGIPGAGRAAARRLAEELLRGWTGDDDCALPSRVTNVSREGISFTVMDKQEFLDDLRTGVYEVDLFLRAVNPDRARKRARVYSPDVAKARRTTVAGIPTPTMPDEPLFDGGSF